MHAWPQHFQQEASFNIVQRKGWLICKHPSMAMHGDIYRAKHT
jgi:hypothetical protein